MYYNQRQLNKIKSILRTQKEQHISNYAHAMHIYFGNEIMFIRTNTT